MGATTKVKTHPAATKIKKPKSVTSILGTEIEELGKGLLSLSPTSEVKPIKKALGEGEKIGENIDKKALSGIPGAKAVEDAAKTAESAGSSASAIASTLKALTEPSTWVRIGKVIAGALLIAIGLFFFAKAFGAAPTAAKAAGAAANVVAPEAIMARQAAARAAAKRAPRTAARIKVHTARRQTIRREQVIKRRYK